MKNAPGLRPAVGLAVAALLVGASPPANATTAARTAATTATLATHATPTTAAAGLRAMPRAYRLVLQAQFQTTNYYCVPASTAMSLSTFGIKVSQDALARKMKTTIRGTGGDNAASVMDGYLHPRRYDDRIVGDVVGRPQILMQRVSYDVGTLRRAPIMQVWMERLPWNQGRLRGHWIGHAILAYGYDQNTGMITVFDPWRPTGGTHTLPAKVLAKALQSGAGMHYISRR
ncbi:C39 family peptidase [Actinoallomurus oryzae]|uniref:C39 family peptidase n=1 Tax=Actinoallomurus oryzae TaxID=502180 RepID=UPI0031ECF264